jgi:hypothetical protein
MCDHNLGSFLPIRCPDRRRACSDPNRHFWKFDLFASPLRGFPIIVTFIAQVTAVIFFDVSCLLLFPLLAFFPMRALLIP